MKPLLIVSLAILFFACGEKSENATSNNDTTNPAMAHNTLTDIEKEAGWQLLFDGKSTAQWRGYNHPTFPDKGWKVDSEGNLTVSKSGTEEAGFGGDIITRERFENFEFKVDFMVSDTGNSGVFYRVVEVANTPIWHNAPEYQILDNQTYIDMGGMDMTTHLTGDDYDLQPSKADYSKPVGEWNTARIVVNNNNVEYWLNGHQTITTELESPEWEALVAKSKFKDYPLFGRTVKGHIGLQDHGHLIKFRNIKIRPMPSGYGAIFNGKDLTGWEIYGTEKWYVENGELICESGPDKAYGYLGTQQEYKNFDLSVDFKQEANGNSGIFFRSSIDGVKISGWQAEVAPPGDHSGGIYESYGRGWLIQPDSTLDYALKMGDWNNMRIKVVDDHVETWLNGVPMIDLTDEKIGQATGKVALQIHDGGGIKVRWRNIGIRQL